MISIKDVALEAGVSVTTVSHVVNSTRYVAPATKEKVEKAINDLGYQPSSLARALKVKSTKTIGMLVSSSTNPFFAEVVQGVEEGCYQKGFSLILCNSGDQHERHLSYLRTLMQKRIDALVVMTKSDDEIFNEQLKRLKTLPKILLDFELSVDGCAIVDDSILGGTLAANHLLEHGFFKIGCLTGPVDHPRSRDRLKGFIEAVEVSGLSIRSDWIIADDLSAPGGYHAMKKLLQAEEQPNAVFACNDMMAIGAYRAIQERGLVVGRDISIIGYDDLELAAYLTPSLTTVHQPSFDLGLKAADILIDHLENKTELPKLLKFQPNLVVRDSVSSNQQSLKR